MNAKQPRPVYNITPFTLLDYPDKTACIIWFAGCNMRCLYCYNPDIVLGKGNMSFDDVFAFLASRKGLLDGVVLSGGECSIHKQIVPFIGRIRDMGFSVKMDTNGSSPEVVQELVQAGLVDYIALDFKALPSQFRYVTQSDLFTPFENTLSYLVNSQVNFEVRTTVHSELIGEEDLSLMVRYLAAQRYRGKYYVQHFINHVPTLAPLGISYKKQINRDFSIPTIEVVYRT